MSHEARFIELISENKGIVHKVINLYVEMPEDREDLFQEIVLQAWQSFERLKGHSKFSTWLYQISLNTVLVFRKKENRKARPVANEKLMQSASVKAIDEPADILLTELRKLPEVDRLLITMHLDGYTNEEIAEVSGITRNHVAVKLHRIKANLTEKLK